MTARGVAVVRAEPGNARTAARLRALGLDTLALPLFESRATAWQVPSPPVRHDALLITSAATVRLAGPGLRALATVPVVAVGAASAAAARVAGLHVALTGTGDVVAAVAAAHAAGLRRLLHLAGRDHVAAAGVEAVVVYASEALPPPPDAAAQLAGRVVLLHSARGGAVVAALLDARTRRRTVAAAISPAALAAAGRGWACAAAAACPTDAALIALAHRLTIDRVRRAADKAP